MQHGLSEKECVAEGLLAIAAGSETTATIMRIILLCLLSNPPVYAKLKASVKDTVTKGSVSEPISYAEAKGIPYLQVRNLVLLLPPSPPHSHQFHRLASRGH